MLILEKSQEWRSFNSRTREGATFLFQIVFSLLSFNSRTREGATKNLRVGVLVGLFQFTHP